MKKLQKAAAVVLSFVTLLAVSVFAPVSAGALQSGDYVYTVLADGTAQITEYTGTATTVSLPSTLNGYTVTSLGNWIFNSNQGVTSVTIPGTVTTLDGNIFWCCPKLTSVTVASGSASFSSTDGVLFSNDKTELIAYPQSKSGAYTIPGTVKEIAYNAFANNALITSVTIPQSVTLISSSAFENCVKLASVSAAQNDNLIISMYAFNNTAYVNNFVSDFVTIGSGYLIKYDGTAQDLTIPSTIKCICDGAFQGNIILKKVTIPASVQKIGEYALANCTQLADIQIPSGLNNIASTAFLSTPWLTNYANDFVVIGDGLLYKYKGSDEAVTIPGTVKKIGDYAFSGNSSIASVIIPSSVTEIGQGAFSRDSSLDSVTIGSGVTEISTEAFKGCEKLKNIAVPSTVTSVGERAFGYGDGVKYAVTLCGNNGSAAQEYASANSFGFVSETTQSGDMNGDGKINLRDNAIMQSYAGDITVLTAAQLKIGDMNGDGKVNMRDASFLQKLIAE